MEIRQNVDPNDIGKRYLGDGVYASFDGFHIWIQTLRDGYRHKIALDPEVFAALCKYAKDIHRMEE